MNILLVEDEEHKTTDLINRLRKAGFGEGQITVTRSVREAVLAVLDTDYDLLVLDMALPTFSKIRPDEGGGGVAQAVGGVEVLRALSSCGKSTKVIVVTQYPEVIVNGEKLKLQNVGKAISTRYNQRALGAVLYSYNSPKWEASFDNLLRIACAS